jgi:carbon-monoxide dehydrogenase medium subunit
MRLKTFEFFDPPSLADVLDLLGRFEGRGKLIAGGTDLLVQMKNHLLAPEKVINLMRVPELKGLEEKSGELRIGALVSHGQMENAPVLKGGWEILSEAARKVGSVQIRHRGTLGGNLCNASPSADMAPPLLVLGAEVNLAGTRGGRRIPLESFFLGPGNTAIQPDEVLVEVFVPEAPPHSRGAFLKLGRRKSLDLALVSVAVLLTLDEDGVTCRRARIALGGVAPTPLRAKQTEKALEGQRLDGPGMLRAGQVAADECQPISDIRASAIYRREMVRVLTERAIKKCLGLPIPPTGI